MAERRVEVKPHQERDRWTWTAAVYDGRGKSSFAMASYRTYRTHRAAVLAAKTDIGCLGLMTRIEVLDG